MSVAGVRCPRVKTGVRGLGVAAPAWLWPRAAGPRRSGFARPGGALGSGHEALGDNLASPCFAALTTREVMSDAALGEAEAGAGVEGSLVKVRARGQG